MAYTVIEEFSPEEVSDYRTLKGNQGQFKKGIFISESPKIVEVVLNSTIEVHSAFLTREYFEQFETSFARHPENIRIYIAAKPVMEEVIGYHLHQGVMLACKIPASPQIEDFRPPRRPSRIVALDGIADAENMGAIIRNCAAFEVDAILLDESSCNPYLRRSVRVSMGTIARTTFLQVPSLPDALEYFHSRGTRIIAASLGNDSVALDTFNCSDDLIIVFGSEGWGIRSEVSAWCDKVISIPIAAGVDSLNVAIANGIFLHALQVTTPK